MAQQSPQFLIFTALAIYTPLPLQAETELTARRVIELAPNN
jgi:hypothetical protein